MLFQTLDDKKECIGVFAEGELHFDNIPEDLTHTWSCSSSLGRDDVEFAQIYCQGKTLSEVCPEHLAEDYERVSSKMRAFLNSFINAKISLREHCFYDLVPKRFLLEFFSVKNEICKWVFENYEKPVNHSFVARAMKMTSEISHQTFEVDKRALDRHIAESRVRQFRQRLSNGPQTVNYNVFGTVTGRLTTSKDSFPILTLDKKFRKIIKPKNDWLVELDFNAAELRTLLGLSGNSQPEEDIHQWNIDKIYNGEIDREEAKKKIFSWLYNPNSVDNSAEIYYNRDKLVEKYFDGSNVKTPFGRTIEAEDRVALNYLIQSTSSDIFLNSAMNVWEKLSKTRSEIRFLVHDSVLIDLADEDKEILPELIDVFSKTPVGDYKVGVSIGKDYGNMRKMK
jgi:hypothetical protein